MRRDLKHKMFGGDSNGIPQQLTCNPPPTVSPKKNKTKMLVALDSTQSAVTTRCQLVACHIIDPKKKRHLWQMPTAPNINAPSICAD